MLPIKYENVLSFAYQNFLMDHHLTKISNEVKRGHFTKYPCKHCVFGSVLLIHVRFCFRRLVRKQARNSRHYCLYSLYYHVLVALVVVTMSTFQHWAQSWTPPPFFLAWRPNTLDPPFKNPASAPEHGTWNVTRSIFTAFRIPHFAFRIL